MIVDSRRILKLNEEALGDGPVVYWMSRDQRVADNWALLRAQELANKDNKKLIVVFCLEKYLTSNLRQYNFMLLGLKELSVKLSTLGIGFNLLMGDAVEEIPKYIKDVKAGVLITDFMPLKSSRDKKKEVSRKIDVLMELIDAHNIVPTWIASPKQEFAAYTFRPKVTYLLNEFLTKFPELEIMKNKYDELNTKIDVDNLIKELKIDMSVNKVDWIKPGEDNAVLAMKTFIKDKLDTYATNRNNPNLDNISNLSPYLHFGQLSAQRLALEVSNSHKDEESIKAYLEELIVRRELSDNYCFYNSAYKTYEGFPDWAKKSHAIHEKDKREYLYSLEELENSRTHDELWNAAQNQMVRTGKMHGYLRMYWAKKILEWTKNPSEAMEFAVHLNDKYELDGRDPNGYVGIAWSIGGLHDRPWFNRPVFGQIRYMSYSGMKNKFKIDEYISKYS